jgi:hypothetical protein
MTNHATTIVGVVLSSAALPGSESVVQVAATLIGTGLLTWIAVMQGREIARLRSENRDLSRELGKKCRNCELAQAANDMLTHAGKESQAE